MLCAATFAITIFVIIGRLMPRQYRNPPATTQPVPGRGGKLEIRNKVELSKMVEMIKTGPSITNRFELFTSDFGFSGHA